MLSLIEVDFSLVPVSTFQISTSTAFNSGDYIGWLAYAFSWRVSPLICLFTLLYLWKMYPSWIGFNTSFTCRIATSCLSQLRSASLPVGSALCPRLFFWLFFVSCPRCLHLSSSAPLHLTNSAPFRACESLESLVVSQPLLFCGVCVRVLYYVKENYLR